MLTRFLALIYAIVASQIGVSAAADMKFISKAGDVSFYSLTGSIQFDDGPRFSKLIEGAKKGIIFLDSLGGNLSSGLWIGAKIHEAGLSTAVLPGKICASSCALIWLAGKNKYFSEDTKVGFHAAYIEQDGKPVASSVANAKIGAYLNELKLSIEAVEFATAAPPENVLWLTKDVAQALGIQTIDLAAIQSTQSTAYPKAQFRASAERAVKLFKSVVDARAGMVAFQAMIDDCYNHTTPQKNLEFVAMCYMTDLLAQRYDAGFVKSIGFPPTPYHTLERVNARVETALQAIGINKNERDKYIHIWADLAVTQLRAGSKG